MFYDHLDYFRKPSLGGRPNTKPGEHGAPNAHNRWFILLYYVRGPAWIDIRGCHTTFFPLSENGEWRKLLV